MKEKERKKDIKREKERIKERERRDNERDSLCIKFGRIPNPSKEKTNLFSHLFLQIFPY